MVETITQEQFLDLLETMGPHAWWVYSAMVALSQGGECRITQDELAAKLGVSVSSIKRYVTVLTRFTVNGRRLVSTSREMDSNVYRLVSLRVVTDETTSPKETIQRNKTVAEEIWDYWMTKYEERYGVKYRPRNWGKDKGCLKRLVDRYEGDAERLKAIIDVVMRLYDSHWKTKQFLRPTVGQLASWLAAQAEPFAVKAAEEPEPETQHDDEVDLMELIDRKWGG